MLHGQAVTLAQEVVAPGLLIRSLTAAGAAEHREGRMQEAERRYEQALDLAQQQGDQSAEAVLRNNLGLVRQGKGEAEEAAQLFRQAMALNQALGNFASEASNHVNLGILAEGRSEYDIAEREFERALELDKTAEHRTEIAADLLRLGRVADRRGFPDRALAYSERAYRSYLAQGDLTQAGAALTQAIIYARRFGAVEETARLEKELRVLVAPRTSR